MVDVDVDTVAKARAIFYWLRGCGGSGFELFCTENSFSVPADHHHHSTFYWEQQQPRGMFNNGDGLMVHFTNTLRTAF